MEKRFILGCALVIGLAGGVLAQNSREVSEESEETKSKFFAYGLTTNTHSGLLGGFVLRSSTPVSTTKKNLPIHRYLALELVNVKHQKENQSPTRLGTKFIFGKTNYLFAIRPEYGREWYFFKKGNESSIGLSGILAGGPTLGVLKPYYIKYGANTTEQAAVVVYDPDIHTDVEAIIGSTSIWQGFLNNVKIVPGIHVKGALNLDMSTFGDKVTGLELGTVLELFTKSPEIISTKLSSNPKAFASLYLTLYFGSKKVIKK